MIERTEFATDPAVFTEKLDESDAEPLGLWHRRQNKSRLSGGFNHQEHECETILLDLNERFFSMADNNGRNAELIYICAYQGRCLATRPGATVNSSSEMQAGTAGGSRPA
jgi:hypothetical protein